MPRRILPALVIGAVGIATASAEPLSLNPNAYGAAPDPAPRVVAQAASAQTAAASRANLGGGFIQFVFGGGSPVTQPPAPGTRGNDPGYGYGNPEPIQTEDPAAYEMDPRYEKQIVAYGGDEKPGTIIIDTRERFLYLVEAGGRALRYGVGVGRPGFAWAGVKEISMKREWPDWRPPDEMLKRRPDLPSYMAGGPQNPLGARAMYLGSSLYRIHGSNEPWTIGTQVSSGCIRMRNEDVIDLYDRVKVGTKVVVI
jgi:lipoprotein-anchoring transpeptidase ErfK/SrfK